MTSPRVNRRLAAILAADIAGYSRLMGEDDAATVRDLKGLQGAILPLVAEFGGRIIDIAGDGILAEFQSAVAAAECALRIQALVADRNSAVALRRRMQFRIGLNLGEVIHDEQRIFGDGINIAARLENLAEPGGICISAKFHAEIEGKLALTFADLGALELKNIAKPVQVFSINLAPSVSIEGPEDASLDPASAQAIRRLSIVVLPFINANGNPAQDYFADGITEDVTTQLSSIKGSFVIGRNTAFRFKNKPIDVGAIGRELGVRYVLQGSVERLPQGVDTTVRLIDSVSGESLWLDTIEVDSEGVRNIRREVVARMTIALKLPLINAEAKRSLIDRPTNPDVVDLVMQGRSKFYRRYTLESVQQAQELFERALAIKSDDQPALVCRACMLVDQVYGWLGSSGGELLAEAENVMAKAMPLDGRDAYAHHVMSRLRQMQGRLAGAIAENQIALELNPNLVEAMAWSGFLHGYNGHPELAIEPLRRAMSQSPKDRLRWAWSLWFGGTYLLMAQYEDAILWLERSIAINPMFWMSFALLAAAYANAGDLINARRAKAQFEVVYCGEDLDFRRYSGNPAYIKMTEDYIFTGWRKVGIAGAPAPRV